MKNFILSVIVLLSCVFTCNAQISMVNLGRDSGELPCYNECNPSLFIVTSTSNGKNKNYDSMNLALADEYSLSGSKTGRQVAIISSKTLVMGSMVTFAEPKVLGTFTYIDSGVKYTLPLISSVNALTNIQGKTNFEEE